MTKFICQKCDDEFDDLDEEDNNVDTIRNTGRCNNCEYHDLEEEPLN